MNKLENEMNKTVDSAEKIYRLEATFECRVWDNDSSRYWWKGERMEILSVIAKSDEGAKERAVGILERDFDEIRGVEWRILNVTACAGKVPLTRNIVTTDNTYRSDGIIMLRKDLACAAGGEEWAENPFLGWESKVGESLGSYAVYSERGGKVAVFKRTTVALELVQRVNKLGIAIHEKKGGRWPGPLVLVKDGEYVGIIMPLLSDLGGLIFVTQAKEHDIARHCAAYRMGKKLFPQLEGENVE